MNETRMGLLGFGFILVSTTCIIYKIPEKLQKLMGGDINGYDFLTLLVGFLGLFLLGLAGMWELWVDDGEQTKL